MRFLTGCPNCDGEISDERLINRLPCHNCLDELPDTLSHKSIAEILKQKGKLHNYESIIKLEEEIAIVDEIFKSVIFSEMWGAQKSWAKRILQFRSFAITAPTGMGKTTFGIIMSLYLAKYKNYRCYILVPTTLLAEQITEKIIYFNDKLNFNIKISYFYSMSSKKTQKIKLEEIANGEFQILITTSSFLVNKFELIKDIPFDFIFVDDVDSFVRTSKNVDKVLHILGFDSRTLEIAYKLLNTKEMSDDEILDSSTEIENYIKSKKKSILVVSGASIRAKRSKKIKLFKNLLNFEIGYLTTPVRNIEDVYITAENEDIKEIVIKMVKQLGPGGLIFVPMDKGQKFMLELNTSLNITGIKSECYDRPKSKLLDKFCKGMIEVLVGMVSYRSPLTRGIDLPENVKYALFAGVPKSQISLDVKDFSIPKAIMLLNNLHEFISENEIKIVDKYLARLKRYLAIPKPEQDKLTAALIEDIKLEGISEKVRISLEKIRKFIAKILNDQSLIEKLKNSEHHSLKISDGVPYLIVPDTTGYIQASGRTSRMYPGGISKGLSICIVDDIRAFNRLKQELGWYEELIKWKNIDEIKIEEVMKLVNDDRKKIQLIKEGVIQPELKEKIKNILLLVESPTKARTISRFFGTPHRRTILGIRVHEVILGNLIINITSTGGHIFNLVTDNGYHGVILSNGKFIPLFITIKTCPKCRTQYTNKTDKCPACNIQLKDKKDIILALKELAKEADEIYIATDADSEGEKIGWDAGLMLAPYSPVVKRIEFHEVTKRALLNAINSPREFNMKLIESQLVRRTEDRWIGFELSMKLWEEFKNRTLSAGRVQTPVLSWISERTKNLNKFCHDIFEISLENGLKIQLRKEKMKKKEINKFIDEIKNQECEISDLSIHETIQNPPPPYTTDSLIKDASWVLKFSVNETMRLAQSLFEMGFITYHRTDSTRVSSTGIGIAKDYIVDTFGEDKFRARPWSGAEVGAHECIRPTRSFDRKKIEYLLTIGALPAVIKPTAKHLALYNLIFRRFIASQMSENILLKAKYKIRIYNEYVDRESIVGIAKEGFSLISPVKFIKDLSCGKYKVIDVKYRRVPDYPLFSQGEIVDEMKKKNIGRPSTYARIIETLLNRKYVSENKHKKLLCTPFGFAVCQFLNSKYGKYLSEETTRQLEITMDEIEEGKKDYQKVLSELYEQLMEMVSE